MSTLLSHDVSDVDLEKPAGDDFEGPGRPSAAWLVGVLLIAAAGVAAYVVYHRRPLPPQVVASAPKTVKEATPPPVAEPLGAQAEPAAVPPLDQSDAFVRTTVRTLSTHPAVAAWLTTGSLVRNFTVVVTNIADGTTPAKFLKALGPSAGLRTADRGGRLYIDERSYGRYTAVSEAVASVDPVGAARLYTTLKPRIEEAYQDLGFPGPLFDRALERAIVSLLKTPTVEGPVALQPAQKGIGYAFADQRLENLTAAQKQLLRMGPRNARIIKDKLRAVALALGIPSNRLPAA